MTDNAYPEIDGLKIIHREPGWEAEWAKVISFLFDKHPDLLSKYSFKALYKYRSLWNEEYKNMQDEFTAFLFEEWTKEYCVLHKDKKGNIIQVQSNYDPDLATSSKYPPFISYLLGSIYKCHLASKFIKKHSSTADLFKQKHKISVRAKGIREGKSKEEIKKDENLSFKNIYIPNKDKENSHEEWLSDQDKPRHCKPEQGRFQNAIQNIVKQYICHLNDECKNWDEDHFLSHDNRQAGAQLYPEMVESSLLDTPEVWMYSDQKQPVCNQKGIQWLLQKTLNVIEQNNPEQTPEQTLYEVHQKAYQKTNCKRDIESEATEDSITLNPAFNRCFAPITDFGDLKRLFGITTEENARAERSRYTRSIAKWLNQNREMLETIFDSIK